MDKTISPSASDRYLGHLDALRGIAILGVMLVHATLLTQQDGRFLLFGFTGQRGVQLFYMISAFTLCLSLDSERKEEHPLGNYFIRRFFRIAPLFYLAILGTLCVDRIAPHYCVLHDLPKKDVALGFFFLNGVSPQAINRVVEGGWSIAVETTFYLLLPFLHRHFNTVKRTLLLFVISAPVLGFASHFLALRADKDGEAYFSFFWFPVEFPVFVLGMLTYCLWKKYIAGRQIDLKQRREVSAVLLGASFMLYCACLPFTNATLYFSSFLFLPLILGLSLFPWPQFVNPFTRFIGKISYSLYLMHSFVLVFLAVVFGRLDLRPSHPVTHFILGKPLAMAAAFLFLLIVSVGISVLSWRFVEQPGMRLGRRWITQREHRAGAKAAPLVPALEDLSAQGNSRDAQF